MATKQYKRDLKAMEARRRKGMRMIGRGLAQADIARELEVNRQTVSTWSKRLEADPQGWRRHPLGIPGALAAAEKGKVAKLLIKGAEINGFPTEVWTLARVGKLIAREFGPSYGNVHVMCLLR